MSFTKITSRVIAPGAVTAEALAPGVGGGPAIANVQIANSSYSVLDDTAVSLDGGYIIINGENFDANVQVLIGSNVVTSVTYVSENQVRAEVGSSAAGSKIVYLVNTDTGATAIRVNGLTYSGTPTWVTDTALPESLVNEVINVQLSATSDSNVSYSLASGSSLPSGLSLAANGLLSGTVTGLENDTLYNFTIEATDQELQNSPRTFSVTIAVSDEYFNQTVLLLNGDGTNGAQNNTFLDSSTNNFTITRNGNTTQGTFSPFSVGAGEWSNYFDGSGDYLSGPTDNAISTFTGDFTIEMWANFSSIAANSGLMQCLQAGPPELGWQFYWRQANTSFRLYSSALGSFDFSYTPTVGSWIHIALSRSGTSLRCFVNGTQVGTTQTMSGTVTRATVNSLQIGGGSYGITSINGYLSNARLVNGTAVYTAAFTPPTAPLTAITNTSLLTCQSNRFVDNSSNAFAITRNGDVRVTTFSPFAPSAAYDPAVNGGSGYFDGSGDYLAVANDNTFDTNSTFTLECFIYLSSTANQQFFTRGGGAGSWSTSNGHQFLLFISSGTLYWMWNNAGSTASISTTAPAINQWVHLAVGYNGTTTRFWVNGNSVGSSATGYTLPTTRNIIRIGGGPDSTSDTTNGFISSLRFVKGSDVYGVSNTTITVPTAPPTAITNTSLLCNFTNAGIFDNTGKNNLETVGNAQIDTTTKKFGTGSMEFDGTGDYLSLRAVSELQLGSGDWTVECWTYFNATNVIQDFFNQWNGSAAGSSYAFLYNNSNTSLEFYWYVSSATNVSVSWTPSSATWYHIAFSKSGTTLRIFVNGIQQGSNQTVSTTPAISTQNVAVGGMINPARSMNGYIDDLRITKGVARYTSNFTAPTRAHRLK